MIMSAKNEIEKLKAEFVSLNTNEEKQIFDKKIRNNYASKSEKEKTEFANAFVESAKEECEKAEQLYNAINIKLKLANILDVVSMSYIAENYFHKSKAWFSQRLNGHRINGNPATFNSNELGILSNALNDIGNKVKNTARSIS
jgi:hypothetical protein